MQTPHGRFAYVRIATFNVERDTEFLFPRNLPGKASFRFAVRRVTRIGEAAGLPLEDLGVVPDELHEFTRDDVLNRNVDLINHAAAMLAGMPRQRLVAASDGQGAVVVRCENVDCVDAYLQRRPLCSTRVRGGTFTLDVPLSRRFSRELRLEGFRRSELVAATRLVLPPVHTVARRRR